MDESLYDEFGNYLGPDLEDDEDDLEYEQERLEQDEGDFDANYDQQQQQENEDEDEVMGEENALMRVDGNQPYRAK